MCCARQQPLPNRGGMSMTKDRLSMLLRTAESPWRPSPIWLLLTAATLSHRRQNCAFWAGEDAMFPHLPSVDILINCNKATARARATEFQTLLFLSL
ncbi:hypothetical protein AAFF_G00289260 [Aldrovandia affinis]|uniref:Uncharacterized protein n=1 Tax=Aldrovandia affinis TaxID=143900 RepID=A0AAD7W111_9TELE|nr:hypothetical protein AAFF_G00289260 [Aldrovandia affinis]